MAEVLATQRRAAANLAADGAGLSYKAHVLVATRSVAAGTASGTTIDFGRIPSNARILPSSTVYWDDLTTTGSPTLDVGLAAVNGNLVNANDPNALADGLDVTSAGTNMMPADHANAGLPAWDLVASESSDPGGELKVYGSIVDAATAGLTGDVTLELYYYTD